MDKTDGLYIGQGTSDVAFSSSDPENPARYYLLSGPAHKNYPTQKTTRAEAVKASLGSVAEANVRTLYKYISPSWSIHSGAATSNYTFIWGMLGENQIFNDLDAVDLAQIK